MLNPRREWRAFAWVLVGVWIAAMWAAAAARAADLPPPLVRVGELPRIALLPRPATAPDVAGHVRQLIASLATLDDAHFDMAGAGIETAFAAMHTRREDEDLFMDDRVINTWPPFRELVTLGPDALPGLLAALDDPTPTKVVYRHEPDADGLEYGEMYYAAEFSANPLDPAETRNADFYLGSDEPRLHVYPLKVGDVCFLAVGQIVGRSYHPARYQQTQCIVINSPGHTAKIRDAVRRAWASADSRRRLFESLCLDYATVPAAGSVPHGGPYESNEFQCNAATRLLYYFPRESAGLIAARLDGLGVTAATRPDAAAAVRPVQFVEAVAWSTDPAVRAAVGRVFARTDDPDVVLAAAPAVTDKAALTPRLLWAAGTVRGDLSTNDMDNRARWAVRTLVDRVPEAAEQPLQAFMGSDEFRIWLVTDTLAGSGVTWDVDLLGPLLTDTRRSGPMYRTGRPGDDMLERRVCDNVAVTLASNHLGLHFALAGTYADLDRQIAAMRRAVATR